MSVSASSDAPLPPMTIGGLWPAFVYSITPVAGSSRPAKSVTNLDAGRFSFSDSLSLTTRSRGDGSSFVKILKAVCSPAIRSAAVTPLPLTSAMTK